MKRTILLLISFFGAYHSTVKAMQDPLLAREQLTDLYNEIANMETNVNTISEVPDIVRNQKQMLEFFESISYSPINQDLVALANSVFYRLRAIRSIIIDNLDTWTSDYLRNATYWYSLSHQKKEELTTHVKLCAQALEFFSPIYRYLSARERQALNEIADRITSIREILLDQEVNELEVYKLHAALTHLATLRENFGRPLTSEIESHVQRLELRIMSFLNNAIAHLDEQTALLYNQLTKLSDLSEHDLHGYDLRVNIATMSFKALMNISQIFSAEQQQKMTSIQSRLVLINAMRRTFSERAG